MCFVAIFRAKPLQVKIEDHAAAASSSRGVEDAKEEESKDKEEEAKEEEAKEAKEEEAKETKEKKNALDPVMSLSFN